MLTDEFGWKFPIYFFVPFLFLNTSTCSICLKPFLNKKFKKKKKSLIGLAYLSTLVWDMYMKFNQ